MSTLNIPIYELCQVELFKFEISNVYAIRFQICIKGVENTICDQCTSHLSKCLRQFPSLLLAGWLASIVSLYLLRSGHDFVTINCQISTYSIIKSGPIPIQYNLRLAE